MVVMDENPILDSAASYLRDHVRPFAQEIDLSVNALRKAFDGLAERGLLAMRRPMEFGGPDLDEKGFRHFQEEVARASGSLSFLQTQHQSAVSMISKGANDDLKHRYLPHMANGERLVGIGFSQLRRPGPPVMRATEVKGGYMLDGHVPWVTGWSFYPEFLIGAALPDGRSVMAVVPLETGPGVKVNEPMRLAAMDSAQTVTVDFTEFFVPEEQVSAVAPVGWIQNNDQINVALQRHFALGCALAGLDILKEASEKKTLVFLQDAYKSLAAELEACRKAATPVSESDLATDSRLEARAWAIDLAVRCAQAAIAATGGSANSVKHPAQRVYREALVYTVSAQTLPIMEATLKRLVRRR